MNVDGVFYVAFYRMSNVTRVLNALLFYSEEHLKDRKSLMCFEKKLF